MSYFLTNRQVEYVSVQRTSYGLREEKKGGESGTYLGTTPKGGRGKITT